MDGKAQIVAVLERTAEATECPKCKASWPALRGMLEGDPQSENFDLAAAVVVSCGSCITEFRRLYQSGTLRLQGVR